MFCDTGVDLRLAFGVYSHPQLLRQELHSVQTQTSQVSSVTHAFLTCMMVSHLELDVVACEVPVKLAEQLVTHAFTQWMALPVS